MNFADNGRHLAEQDYAICVRQEEGEIGETRSAYSLVRKQWLLQRLRENNIKVNLKGIVK
jgi:hypothetical protein